MIIIAFAQRTSKILPKIICRKWRHCAPIVPDVVAGDTLTMYQFVRRGCVAPIALTPRDINILCAHGWRFICVRDAVAENDFALWAQSGARGCVTCVQLSRRAIGWRGQRWQTPAGLMRELRAQ